LGSRLVENDNVGIVHQGLRDAYALFVAAREALDQLRAAIFQVGFAYCVGDARGALIGRDVLDARNEVQKVLDGHIGIHRRSFGQVANVAADLHGIAEHVEAGDLRGAGRGRHVSGEDTHGGGLARAVRTEETENFAFIYGERHVIYGRDRAVGFRQILNFYQCIPPLRAARQQRGPVPNKCLY
jgi:hypothetical protein